MSEINKYILTTCFMTTHVYMYAIFICIHICNIDVHAILTCMQYSHACNHLFNVKYPSTSYILIDGWNIHHPSLKSMLRKSWEITAFSIHRNVIISNKIYNN